MDGLPPHPPFAATSSRAPTHMPPMSGAGPRAPATHVQSPLVSSKVEPPPEPTQASEAPSAQGQPVTPVPTQHPPPNTLAPSPKIVSEQITPTIPSPTANNTTLLLYPDEKKEPMAATGGEEDWKKKKRSKEDKKKEKEDEKQKLKEKKEKEKAERERMKKERERLEKEKKKEKGGKKKDKGGGEAEDKNGAASTAAPTESA